MHDLIRRLVHWLGLLFGPGTGTHRAGDRSPVRPAHLTPRPDDSLCLPLHRSPYRLHLPLDGAETRLIRPYLVAHEQEQALRRRRRLTLVLAADFGIDLDQHVIGAKKAAA
ncbi:hypothetical protein [Streptomyces kebangsaanensis]|uniref:hypothetical protein n=1 Tax=Streptomyces kebangsaanensis TaxID=864058 RepID=UPI00093EB2F8|nr:hypothetical protein [Streptomyces kebangsaanensis]